METILLTATKTKSTFIFAVCTGTSQLWSLDHVYTLITRLAACACSPSYLGNLRSEDHLSLKSFRPAQVMYGDPVPKPNKRKTNTGQYFARAAGLGLGDKNTDGSYLEPGNTPFTLNSMEAWMGGSPSLGYTMSPGYTGRPCLEKTRTK